MVLFHPHEGCFQIRLGIAVAVFPHDLKAFLIPHQAASAFFQFLIEFLDLRLMFPFSENKSDPFLLRNPHQVFLQFQDLKGRTVIDLNDGVIGDLFMLCQLPLPVFFYGLPDFVHSFNHEHMGIPEIVFRPISILRQECIVLCIKGIDGIQQAGKMIVEAAPPDESVSVCIRLKLCSVNVKLFQRDKAFLLQTAHKLVIQFIQDFSRQLFSFKIVKNIPLGLLPFCQPDKSKVSLA